MTNFSVWQRSVPQICAPRKNSSSQFGYITIFPVEATSTVFFDFGDDCAHRAVHVVYACTPGWLMDASHGCYCVVREKLRTIDRRHTPVTSRYRIYTWRRKKTRRRRIRRVTRETLWIKRRRARATPLLTDESREINCSARFWQTGTFVQRGLRMRNG